MSKENFTPQWTGKAPPPGSYRSIFKFGEPAEFKHPRAALVSMMKEEFGMKDEDFSRKQFEGNEKVVLTQKCALSEEQINKFREISGPENVATDDYSRVKYSSGQSLKEVIQLRRNKPENVADLVIHPKNKEEVGKILEYCNAQKIPLCVYSGGSSAVMGLAPEKGGVVIVLRTHMNKLLSVNELNQTATVQPGLMGPDFEAALNNAREKFRTAHNYTCGHFPQSFEMSSVGGWVVTLGSGQASTYYGDACDLYVSGEYATPVGTFKTHEYPATATGPKLNDIMKGSEGSFGILVEVTMKIYRHAPENRQRFAFMFPTWESAVHASREIVQGEFGMPAVFRISDPEETDRGLKLFGFENAFLEKLLQVKGLLPMKRCLLVGTAEGDLSFAKNIKKQVKKICRSRGALYLGGGVVKKWEETRYKEPLMREDFMDFGMIVDTLETGVTWDNVIALHREVRAFVKSFPGTICMTHASHFYPGGTNLYFIFMRKPAGPEEFYNFHAGILDSIVKNGGSVTHHHGVGKLLSPWMDSHLGPVQMAALRALKKHFDPNNILNPGNLLAFDMPEDQKRKID